MRTLSQAGDTISAAQQWCRRVATKRQRPSSARLGRRQAGDTIVEVLIAIAVISLVLVGAYVTTTKNMSSTQDAQERTQAVKLAETQIEYFRKAGGTVASGNCFNNSGEQTAGGDQGSNPCIVLSDGTMAGEGDQPAYTLSITPSVSHVGAYAIKAQWASLTGITNNVTMYYRP